MASLAVVRRAVQTTLQQRIDGLHVYGRVPSAPNLPAVVVVPRAATYEGWNLGPGVDDVFQFDLAVLCSAAADEVGQDQLDELLSGAGPRSIRQAIANDRRLGLPRGQVQARVARMDSYGLRFDAAQVEHVGAVLRLDVVVAALP